MRQYTIAVIGGDGIGPEVISEAWKVLEAVQKKSGFILNRTDLLLGGASIEAYGSPLTEETLEKARSSDAVLMGSIGGNPKTSPWYRLPAHLRPEAGLLGIRKGLGLFANLRPARLYDELRSACPLRNDIGSAGFDMLIIRELTGGLYFGERYTGEKDGVRYAVDTLEYKDSEIRRIAVKAFEAARKRRREVVSVDKANVLESSRLWRKVVEETAADYPDVKLSHMLWTTVPCSWSGIRPSLM